MNGNDLFNYYSKNGYTEKLTLLSAICWIIERMEYKDGFAKLESKFGPSKNWNWTQTYTVYCAIYRRFKGMA